jgi:hypothetical protein
MYRHCGWVAQADLVGCRKDMDNIFEPVYREIQNKLTEHVERVSREVERRKCEGQVMGEIQVFLVGGFGSSAHLKTRLEEGCRAKNLPVKAMINLDAR